MIRAALTSAKNSDKKSSAPLCSHPNASRIPARYLARGTMTLQRRLGNETIKRLFLPSPVQKKPNLEENSEPETAGPHPAITPPSKHIDRHTSYSENHTRKTPVSKAPYSIQRTPDEKRPTTPSANTLPLMPGGFQIPGQLGGDLDLYQGVGPLMASALGSATIDGFETGKAKISESNRKKLAETAKRILKLLKKFPASTIRVTGHTDAIDSDQSNMALGQKRADATAAALKDLGVPAEDIKTLSKGESELLINTQDSEGQNRRVDVRFKPFVSRLTFPGPKLTPPWQSPSPDGLRPPGLGLPPNFTLDSPGIPFGPIPEVPKAKLRNWLEEGLKRDPLLKKLPNWMRDKVVDGLKNADEKVAEKIIDALPLGGKEKAALKAVAKSILQLLKGKKFKMPTPPPRGLDPTIPPFKFPKMPGEVIIKGPVIRF